MRRWLAVVVAGLLVAACGSTSTVTRTELRPPPQVPPQGEGSEPQPKAHPGPAPPYHGASGCGIERWAVKTGTDPGANAVNLTPKPATVAELGAIAPPANPTDRVAPTEATVFRISATITAVKEEADSDFHLALSDEQGHTMIAESPDPGCAVGSVFAAQLQQVRDTILAACPEWGPGFRTVNIPAEITGVGFFDRIHGQRGVAPNGIELHPILDISLTGHC